MATRALIISIFALLIMMDKLTYHHDLWILNSVLFGVNFVLWGLIAIKEYAEKP